MSDLIYDPSDWFWTIPGRDEVYSSKMRSWLAVDDPIVSTWGGLPTRIASEDDLKDVLRKHYPSGLPVDLVSYTAQKRWALETAGITVSGVPVATTRDSQAMIHGAFSMAQAGLVETFQFKSEAGFLELPAAAVIAIGHAVAQHVQACFAWEKDVLAGVAAGTVTREAEIDGLAAGFSA